MVKSKNNKILFILIGIAALFLVFNYTNLMPKSGDSNVINKGVGMQLSIVDENGVVKQQLLGPNQGTFSIISSTTPSGFVSLSDPTCVSGCSFLQVGSSFDNTAGDSDIIVTSATASIACAAGNVDAGCASVPNAFGATQIANTKRGNMNSKFVFPTPVARGTSSSQITSDAISLDEVANALTSNGLIDFKIVAGGTYKDANGDDIPFSGKMGSFTIRAVKSVCADNTPVDYNNADADAVTYCSTAQKGKYCRVNTITGYPVYTDKASTCGCPTGQQAVGQVCKATACAPNACIANSIYYCKSDGVSVEPRCQQCGAALSHLDWCGLDQYNAAATSCNPATTGVISQCVYPSHGTSGMTIQVVAPTIPTTAQCGDGVKNGVEDCDTYDFGGESCSTVVGASSTGTLACSGACTYVTTGCGGSYVKFRTTDNTYVAGTAIGYNSGTCGNLLTRYGKTSGACTTKYCDAVATLAVPTSTGTTKLFTDGADICICEPGVTTHTYAKRYTTADSDAYKVNNIATTLTPALEVAC